MPGRVLRRPTDSAKRSILNNAKEPGIDKVRIPNIDILRILIEVSMEYKLDDLEQAELLAHLNLFNEF